MNRNDPAEVALGRATVSLTALLDREMDAVFQDILEGLGTASACQRRRAASANRIVLLCRNLGQEIQRYERLSWLLRHEPEDEEDEDDQEVEIVF